MTSQDILSSESFACRVSSVLNRNASLFGKKFLFDNDESTCWNSDQGNPQWIKIDFENIIQFSMFEIQFQGGFVGKDCYVETFLPTNSSETESFYPENNNFVQKFKLNQSRSCTSVKFTFNNSEDTYGRIIVYKLRLYK